MLKNGKFNFIERHAKQLKSGQYEENFRGTLQKPGILSTLHLIGGTLFLDEIHSIDKGVLLEFHRIWGKPYEIEPVGGTASIKINVFTIFASNLSPEELKADKFDEAILSRITQCACRIPPLRERKQDIALLVNHFIREKDKGKKIKFIDLDGLRLLTELSWKNTNVRGVEQFVEDLLQRRELRQLENSRVTFEEIIECVRSRNLI